MFDRLSISAIALVVALCATSAGAQIHDGE
jgi:hypothetical protein